MLPRPQALTGAVLAALLAAMGANGCVGTFGLDQDEGVGGLRPAGGGTGGQPSADGGHGSAPPAAGGTGGVATSAGGSTTSSSAGGSGSTDEVPTGGSGGEPLLCVASGPKDCSPTPDPQCPDGAVSNGNFASQVTAAVQYVRDLPANASWFDYTEQPACCPKVGTGTAADKVMFRDAVIDRLNQHADLCAQADPGNHPHEIAVKLNNACSEGYIVLTSGGVVRNPPKHSYNCVPAGM